MGRVDADSYLRINKGWLERGRAVDGTECDAEQVKAGASAVQMPEPLRFRLMGSYNAVRTDVHTEHAE